MGDFYEVGVVSVNYNDSCDVPETVFLIPYVDIVEESVYDYSGVFVYSDSK